MYSVSVQRALYVLYSRLMEVVLFMVDRADRDRREMAGAALRRLAEEPELKHVPLVLLANKQDLPDSLTPEEVSKELSVQELSMSQQCQLLPVCAVTGEGLSDAMDCMVDMVRKWKKGKGKHAR